jgi:hypothetical protein
LLELRVRTPRLELRLPREEELEDIAALAEAGIHPPDEMPFAVAWIREKKNCRGSGKGMVLL